MRRLRPVPSIVTTIVLTTVLSAAVAGAAVARARGAGELRDLILATETAANVQPFDHATAQVVAWEDDGSTVVTLKVQGVDQSVAGTTFGAHVHRGPCVVGEGAAALGHYKHGDAGAQASSANEVWLDVTIGANGTGISTAVVPFTIPAGAAHSVVIHAAPTDPTTQTGAAGPRWACLPVEF